jgi:hypothetical protein
VEGTTYGGKFAGEIKKSGEAVLKAPRNFGHGDLVISTPAGKVVAGTVAFTVDTNGGNKLTGTIINNGQTLATFTAYQGVFTSKLNVIAPFRAVPLDVLNPDFEKGKYTVVLPSVIAPNNGLQASAYPQGSGWATATISASGVVKMIGSLADGTKFTVATILSKDKVIPLFVPLYGGKGCITGEVTLADNASSDGEGTLVWIKPANVPKQTVYVAGWPNGIDLQLLTSRYVAPKASTAGAPNPANPGTALGPTVLPVTTSPTPNIEIILEDGELVPAKSNDGRLSQKGTVVALAMPSGGAADLGLSFKPSKGTFNGSFTHPLTQKKVVFTGVALQKAAAVGGYFLYVPVAGSPDAPSSGSVSVVKAD